MLGLVRIVKRGPIFKFTLSDNCKSGTFTATDKIGIIDGMSGRLPCGYRADQAALVHGIYIFIYPHDELVHLPGPELQKLRDACPPEAVKGDAFWFCTYDHKDYFPVDVMEN
jgi:hypothetical protein